MKSQRKNKTLNKRIFVLILLLFMVIGLGGYGVYSYYWTQGSFDGSASVDIASFDPEVTIDSQDFLGKGGEVVLSCPNTSTGSGSVTCTGTIDVENNGSTDITVEVLDPSSSINRDPRMDDSYISLNDGLSLSISSTNVTFDSNDSSSITIEPHSTETLNMNVNVNIDSVFANDELTEKAEVPIEEYSSLTYGTYHQVLVSFKLKATQDHD